ncbi:hypothetical protein ACFXNW_10790 [Nocardia sp. NPDC059180]|uniref:hypothetical protein n=1 Tax=Nocardia sp. NPDC059180 TaxID=3346761 RepID=UPI00367989BF
MIMWRGSVLRLRSSMGGTGWLIVNVWCGELENQYATTELAIMANASSDLANPGKAQRHLACPYRSLGYRFH